MWSPALQTTQSQIQPCQLLQIFRKKRVHHLNWHFKHLLPCQNLLRLQRIKLYKSEDKNLESFNTSANLRPNGIKSHHSYVSLREVLHIKNCHNLLLHDFARRWKQYRNWEILQMRRGPIILQIILDIVGFRYRTYSKWAVLQHAVDELGWQVGRRTLVRAEEHLRQDWIKVCSNGMLKIKTFLHFLSNFMSNMH